MLRHRRSLTRRESDVLELVAEGKGNSDIAERLNIAPSTVKHYVQQIFQKLGVHTRGEAAAVAWRARMVEARKERE